MTVSALRLWQFETGSWCPNRSHLTLAGADTSQGSGEVLLPSDSRTLAQFSQRDDMLFRGLMIPVGVLLVAIGIRGMRRQRMHLTRYRGPVEGRPAVVIGGAVIVIGVLCSVAAVYSFLS